MAAHQIMFESWESDEVSMPARATHRIHIALPHLSQDPDSGGWLFFAVSAAAFRSAAQEA